MTVQTDQRILNHFFPQLGLHSYFYQSALCVSISGFVLFCFFFQLVDRFYLGIYVVIGINHYQQQSEDEEEIFVMCSYLITVKKIPLYDVHKSESLLLVLS